MIFGDHVTLCTSLHYSVQAKYTEAYNAYNSAHRLDSSDSGVKNKCNLAEKAIRESANPSSSSSSSPASSATASRPASYLTSAQAYLRLFVLVNAVGYLCSVLLAPAMARFCYRNFVFASIADYLLAVHSAHGLPKLNMEYAQRLMLDPSSMYLFLSLLLLMQPPSVLSMAPIFLTALVHSTHYMHGVVQQKSPDTVAKAGELVGKYLPSLMKQSPEAWAGMTASAKWRVFDQQVVATACLCEVLQGLALLLQLVLPSRNFLAAMMWWQYLQMRYMMDQQQQQQQGGAAGVGGGIKKAFAGVDSRLSGMLAHRFCPRGLGLGYGYLRTFLANKVKLPEPGEPAPSMSNMIPKSCTIM